MDKSYTSMKDSSLAIEAPGAGKYDDTNFNWVYTGSWATLNTEGPYNNTLRYTFATGDSASFTFRGTQFILIYTQDTNRANYDVYVDGSKIDQINANGSFLWQKTYISPILPFGTHMAEFKNVGGDGGSVMDVDAIQIFASEINTSEPVQFTYDSQKRKSPAIEELLDLIQYRDLIYQLVRRDIVSRYKRSFLGIAWTMLQPLGMMLVLTAVFNQLFGRVDGYAAYLLSGLIAWTFFAQTTTAAIIQSVWGGTLMRRIYIPNTAFAVSSIGTGVVNLALSMVPLLLIILVLQRPITWAILFLPIAMVSLTAFSLGVGLLLSSLAVRFPDISEMYQIVLQAWMYLTPIMYPSDILPETFRPWLLYFNPMYYQILMFRVPIYDGVLPSMPLVAIGVSIALITLVLGWMAFSYQADNFAYIA